MAGFLRRKCEFQRLQALGQPYHPRYRIATYRASIVPMGAQQDTAFRRMNQKTENTLNRKWNYHAKSKAVCFLL
jgi:hypothetical protein